MIKKIPYPKNRIIELNGSRYLNGEGSWWSKGKPMHKYFFIPRYEKCDTETGKTKIKTICGMRSTFYGYETIGTRVYSIHKCIMGHSNRTRLVQNDGPELSAFLRNK